MIIDDSLINYLETLSRLALTDSEREQAKADMADIIGYMAKLSELDTDGVPALSHPFPAVNHFREDEATSSFPREDILSNAPVRNAEYIKAPKTLE